MPFTIPNEADAGNTNQAEPDAVDFDILTFAAKATGIVDGCAVTAQGIPDMTVAVAAGTVSIAGTMLLVTAANGTITAADATNPRFDLVSINTSGTIVVTAGTAAASPVFPAHPADDVVLAAVYVAANDTAIGSTEITDKRVMVGSRSGGPSGSVLYQSGTSFCPLFSDNEVGTVVSNHIANRFYSWGFVLNSDVQVDALSLEVRVAGVAFARIGIYEGDAASMEPKTLIVDSGALDCSTTGLKTGTVTAFTLKAGVLYFIGFLTDQTNATWSPRAAAANPRSMRQINGWTRGTNLHGGAYISSNPLITYGALPDPITGTTTWSIALGTVPYFVLDVV